MKSVIKKIPVLRWIASLVYFTFIEPFKSFSGSEEYWDKRYRLGGTSGAGSYKKLAGFKADVLNDFIKSNSIKSVIEYGCGDGNQLSLLDCSSYIGFDVSPAVVSKCQSIFSKDEAKSFKLMHAYANESAELTLSLDVIYHLIEDEVFLSYMKRLFDSSSRFVIIYSSNTNTQARLQASHVKHRRFSGWIESNRPEWELIKHIPNKYPPTSDDQEGSFADFYIFEMTPGKLLQQTNQS